jgi:hypothetical protein
MPSFHVWGNISFTLISVNLPAKWTVAFHTQLTLVSNNVIIYAINTNNCIILYEYVTTCFNQ